MKIKSKLKCGSNSLVKAIKAVEINRTASTEIVHVELETGRNIWINTEKNVYAGSEKALKKAVRKSDYTGRLTVPVSLKGLKNNTRIPLYKIVSIADELDRGIVRSDYSDLHCNHKDRTGNVVIYGYTNNRINNLEMVSAGDDERHWKCIERIQELCNVHVAISAEDYEKINVCTVAEDDELIKKVSQWINGIEPDEHGCYFI